MLFRRMYTWEKMFKKSAWKEPFVDELVFKGYKVAWVLSSIRSFEQNVAVDEHGNRLVGCACTFTVVKSANDLKYSIQ